MADAGGDATPLLLAHAPPPPSAAGRLEGVKEWNAEELNGH